LILVTCNSTDDDASSGAGTENDVGAGGDAALDSGGNPDISVSVDTSEPEVTGRLDGGEDAGGLPEISYTVRIGPFTVQPYDEETKCIILNLGNPEEMRVNRIHNVLGDISHHFIIYRSEATEERRTAFNCTPFLETLDPESGSPLMITQVADETLELPDGVAYVLHPNQMIRLELHYVNVRSTPVDVEVTSTLHQIAGSEFEHEADFLFIGSPDINIPANSTRTLGPVDFPLPSNLLGSEFWAITGHTHQWGTDVTISITDGSGGVTPIYDIPDWDWDEPETLYFEPTHVINSGGGFRFSCSWENLGDSSVGFGESTEDEMCFFWAYYYPSRGAFVCFHTEQAGGLDICCPGNMLCDLIEGYL
jgi:hypothetical protein